MGTIARVDLVIDAAASRGDSTRVIDTLLAYAQERLEDLESRWSRFRPTSEISRLNALAGVPVVVSRETYRALEAATDAWATTQGRYDPTVGPVLAAMGYDRTWSEVDGDSPPQARPLPDVPGCASIILLPAVPAVLLPPGVSIDLGAIGKGLAADLLVDELLERGAVGAHVALGGDLRVEGRPLDGAVWEVVIEDPTGAELAVTRLPHGGAVATSGTTYRRWADGHHHVVDPATGRSSASDVAQVSVIANRCAVAEVWATAALVAGMGPGAEVLATANLAGVLVAANGAVSSVASPSHHIAPPPIERSVSPAGLQ